MWRVLLCDWSSMHSKVTGGSLCDKHTVDFFARVHMCMRMRRSMSEGFGLHGAVAGSSVQKKAQTPTPRHAHTHACVHTRTHLHTQIHTRTRTRTHAHEYTHMHTHARSGTSSTLPAQYQVTQRHSKHSRPKHRIKRAAMGNTSGTWV